MEGLSIDDVRRALEAQDSSVVDHFVALAGQYDGYPDDLPQDALTIWSFRQRIGSWDFRQLSDEEKMQYRVDSWETLESDDAAVPLPDRYELHEILYELAETDGAFARETLLEILRRSPVTWGAWRGMKKLFKQSEINGDVELFGVLVARIDREFSNTYGNWGEVKRATLGYLARRGWRRLRRLAQSFPAAYVEHASAVLREVSDSTNWYRAWVAPKALNGYRDLWKENHRPLLSLLERAQSERVRQFAVDLLREEFRVPLRELPADDVIRLIATRAGTVHRFVVWLLENSPRFEQARFRELGLHDGVLSLLDSHDHSARGYAVAYAKAHARDLPVDELLRLAFHDDQAVQDLAAKLLMDRDPREDIGLDAWGALLESSTFFKTATQILRKHFGARELTLEWFRPRLLSDNSQVASFAVSRFAEVHKIDDVGQGFFLDLLNDPDLTHSAAQFGLKSLEETDLTALTEDQLRSLILRPDTTSRAFAWIKEDKLPPESLSLDFLRALAFQPTWQKWEWAKTFTADGPRWAKGLKWNYYGQAIEARRLLGDVRYFTPADLTFDWLIQLVESTDEDARLWAWSYMVEAFSPAEFAPADEGASGGGEVTADLQERTFLFTGKLATMTRNEANKMVSDAGGKPAKSVTKTLDYLVVGDEGSPFYGGSKGSKQRKAESLNDKGSSIAIISETAFLRMLTEGVREFDEADVEAGCAFLWEMATGPDADDGARSEFARDYIRRHHDAIGQALTDKTVEESEQIPASFLSFERLSEILVDPRHQIRRFGLELSRWEIGRWAPSLPQLLPLSESRRRDTRDLLAEALLAEESKETERLRIPRESLDIDGVYTFCESADQGTRAIGLALIEKYPEFAAPARLITLTDSPDRRVRAFVIRTLWALYRDRGITDGWTPEKGPGAPDRPEDRPSDADTLRDLLRRVLFAIPPARFPKDFERTAADPAPVPARREKLFLLETMQELALEDADFAGIIVPLLTEFARSLGKTERGTCLVTLARIADAWPEQDALAPFEVATT